MTKTESNSRINRINAAPRPEPAHADIALCAMTIWVEDGCPQGRDREHWLLAEVRLRQALQVEADAVAGSQPCRSAKNGFKRSQPHRAAL